MNRIALHFCLVTLAIACFTFNGSAQLPFVESFKDTSVTGISFGGIPGAYLTAGKTVSYPGGTAADGLTDGYLRLTAANTNERGYVYSDQSFPAIQGLRIAFEYNTYGSAVNGADGICFFLFNDTTNSFDIGGFGGSLGYTRRNTGGVLEPGLKGAYLGIGIDEYGNFCTYNESRYTGLPSAVPNSVTIRGMGDGTSDYWYNNVPGTVPNYDYITSVQTTALATNPFEIMGGSLRATSMLDTAYRRVEIDLAPRTITVNSVTGTAYTISVRIITGSPSGTVSHNIITNLNYDHITPENLDFGFAASTGGSSNYHEIRNIDIRAYNATASPVAANRTEVVSSGNTTSLALSSSVTPVTAPLGLDSSSLRFINPLNSSDTATLFTIPNVGTIRTDSNKPGYALFTADSSFNTGTATIRFVMNDNYGKASNAAVLTLNASQGITNNTITATANTSTITGSTPAYSAAYTYLWQESTTSSTAGFYEAPGLNNTIDYSVPNSAAPIRWYRRSVNAANYTSYSNSEAFSSSAVPLPLANLFFEAQVLAHTVMLSWKSATEAHIGFYELERASNGADFKHVATIAGKGDNNNACHFTDLSPNAGANQYRLAMHDLNGALTYSNVISVTMSAARQAGLLLYPEPAGNVLQILADTDGSAVIYNAHGSVMLQTTIHSGNNLLATTALPAGIYYLIFENATERLVKRFSRL